MKVELLPSSIPVSRHQFLASFIVNDVVAIDAGSVGLLADLERQRRIRHVFLTHEHIDHIASLPILLENAYVPGPDCVELLAAPDVLEFVHQDLFNGRVWPDFFALSEGADRFVTATPLEPHRPVTRCGLSFTPLPVAHCVGTLGLLVDDGRDAVAFPSDTGPTDEFWRRLAGCDRLRAVFLEVSFPNSLSGLAARTGHHCTASFAAEIQKLPQPVRWIVVHRKPAHGDEIAREIAALSRADVELVQPGCEYHF